MTATIGQVSNLASCASQIVYRCLFVTIPTAAAVVPIGIIDAGKDVYVNLPWGLLYGVAWFYIGRALEFDAPIAIGLGMFVWPTLIGFTLAVMSGVVWRAGLVVRSIAAVVIVLSWFVTMPYSMASKPPIEPVYLVMLSGID